VERTTQRHPTPEVKGNLDIEYRGHTYVLCFVIYNELGKYGNYEYFCRQFILFTTFKGKVLIEGNYK